MSVMAVSGYVPVDAPPPTERLHSLLTVPGVLVPQNELEAHWESGITLVGFPYGPPTAWGAACLDGTFRTKDDGGGLNSQEFTSFVLYTSVTCSTFGGLDIDERVRVAHEASAAWGIEQALVAGIDDLTNPYLADSNLDILAGGTAVSAGVAVSYLEQYLSDFGEQGIIHITPAVAGALQFVPIGNDPGEPLYTAAGTHIAIGQGYVNTTPDGEGNPGDTEDWIFLTGGVEVRLSPTVEVVPGDIFEALDRSTNVIVYRAEQIANVAWDNSHIQAGILVDWAL